MISVSAEKKLLQAMVGLACLVPLAAGLGGAWYGIGPGDPAGLDSHFRYLSGLLLGIGVGFLSTIVQIERHEARFRLLTLIVVIGGVCRLLGVVVNGNPGVAMLAALAMELVVTPLLCLWQTRLARRFSGSPLR